MIEGPIGGAAFNNEFGRPNLFGYFRTLEISQSDGVVRGYHKPIAAPGNGEIAVGWLCVSTLIRICTESSTRW